MKSIAKSLVLLSLVSVSFLTWADAVSVKENLNKTYPNTTFTEVKESMLPGLYQVVMGKNVAYTDEKGRYFLFGNLFDMQTQTDLTAQVRENINKIDFAALPTSQAIKIIKGNGGKGVREFALFSDPDCPYCQRLEETLAGMTDYTVYVYLFPIASLHPDATEKAVGIWCAKNQGQAWLDLMLSGKLPVKNSCKNPVQENVKLASSLGISGTPTMIHKTGKKLSGAVPRATLESWLEGK